MSIKRDWSAVGLMTIATMLFAFSEACQLSAQKSISPMSSLLWRCAFMAVMLYAAAAKFLPKFPPLSPVHVPWIFVMRALCWALTAIFLAVTFSAFKEQTYAYIPFILHPLWTLSIMWLIGDSQPQKIGLFSILFSIMALGFVLFSVVQVSQGKATILFSFDFRLIFPLLAGFFFAATNQISGRIIRNEKYYRSALGGEFTSWQLSLIMTIQSIVCSAAAVVLVSAVAQQHAGVNFVGDLDKIFDWRIFGLLCAAAIFGEVASFLVPIAFARAKNAAVIASIDLTVIVFALPIDLWLDHLHFADLLNAKGFGVVLVLVSAVVLAYQAEK